VQRVAARGCAERGADVLAVPGVCAVAAPVRPGGDDRSAVVLHGAGLGAAHQQVPASDGEGFERGAHRGDLGPVLPGLEGEQLSAIPRGIGGGQVEPCGRGGVVHGFFSWVPAVSVVGSGSGSGAGSGSIRTTSRRRGPCTPSTRSSSMSLVALGPEIIVQAAAGSSPMRWIALGTPSTTCSASTTTTWRSGTRLIARRPP